jgi:hypothetical protein
VAAGPPLPALATVFAVVARNPLADVGHGSMLDRPRSAGKLLAVDGWFGKSVGLRPYIFIVVSRARVVELLVERVVGFLAIRCQIVVHLLLSFGDRLLEAVASIDEKRRLPRSS